MLVDIRHNELTKKIIGCTMAVHRELGHGFPELIYQRGLSVELSEAGLAHQCEVSLPVYYKSAVIGTRRADLLVAGSILLELKAVSELQVSHFTQVINYLKAYRLEVALLLNFGETSLKFRRFLHNPDHTPN
ncbi:GxxExxY protein [Hymenobacter endophyticus]|nr:GxxExxY protein [Hymenobacter endophyticus]